MTPPVPQAWKPILADEVQKPYYHALEAFLAEERAHHTVYPPEPDVFNALKFTPYDAVRVVILGQDPYHEDHQAMGLAFSVPIGVTPPPSLMNIFRELHEDTGFRIPNNGYLVPWAEQGVLLLNTVLTVRAHQANSHRDKGWEQFTDTIIQAVSAKTNPVVFILWGNHAQKKQALINTDKNLVLKAAHPSPLSARRGFFGSKPFSKTNHYLDEKGEGQIDWQLPDAVAT